MFEKKKKLIHEKMLFINAIIQLIIWSLVILFLYVLNLFYALRVLEMIFLGYLLMVLITLVMLKGLRVYFPYSEGIYSSQKESEDVLRWGIYNSLCLINLSLFYSNNLVPIPFRQFFYKFMGAKISKNSFALAGTLTDPHFVEIEDNVILGDEAYISPHAIITLRGSEAMIIKKIILKKNCVVGARAILSPGVIVGEGATIPPMALVPMNTQVAEGKIWSPERPS